MFYISSRLCATTHCIESVSFSRVFSRISFVGLFSTNGSPAVFSRISLKGKKNETLRAIASHFITRAIVSFTKEYTRETQQHNTGYLLVRARVREREMTLKHHDERERLLVKVHHAADADDVREDDDALLKTTKTTFTRSSWMKSSTTLATIVSLLICCAFVAMTASSSESSSLGVSKFRNKGGLLNVYGSKEAGESTASRAKFSARRPTRKKKV